MAVVALLVVVMLLVGGGGHGPQRHGGAGGQAPPSSVTAVHRSAIARRQVIASCELPTPHRPTRPTSPAGAAGGGRIEPIRRQSTMDHAIQVSDVVKTYPLAAGEVVAVDHLSLDIAQGEFVAIVGRSGSGKTTLLNLLAGIDRPTSRTVLGRGRRPWSVVGVRTGRLAGPQRRAGVPVLPAAADADRGRERDAADGLRQAGPAGQRATAPSSSWTRSASATRPTSCPPRCRAASSNAPRSPGRWPTTPRCCWPTSRPATSTRPPPTPCWRCSPA